MNIAGAQEMSYANTAIGIALLQRLVAGKIISLEDASAILDAAAIELRSLGNLASVPGALRIVHDVKSAIGRPI
jgi:hypothetical protein